MEGRSARGIGVRPRYPRECDGENDVWQVKIVYGRAGQPGGSGFPIARRAYCSTSEDRCWTP